MMDRGRCNILASSNNILDALAMRQLSQADQWNSKLLYRFCEGSTVKRLNNIVSWQEIISEKQSTMAIAFSCNGEYLASGHLTHEIVVYCTTPQLRIIQTLSGHARTPWCLTFDPIRPQILYSGCLAGTVHKWNVQTGDCLGIVFNPGISSPINNIVFLPSDPSLVLVAIECWLYLLSVENFHIIWKTKTAFLSTKVRLVLHHPEESRILTAITNPPRGSDLTQPHYLRTAMSLRTTYRLQVYTLHKSQPPDLEDFSHGLVCLAARIFGPRSCVITRDHVICSAINNHAHCQVAVYSIQSRNFGACLYTLPLDQVHVSTNVVSLDLSPSETHLVLGISTRKDVFHMNRSIQYTSLAIIYQINTDKSSKNMIIKEVCTVRSNRGDSSNVTLWMPLASGHNTCLCVGTQKGSVLCSDISSSVLNGHRTPSVCDIVLPSYPAVPIPPIQMVINT